MDIAIIHKDSTKYQVIENVPAQKGTIIYDTEEHEPEWWYYSSDTMNMTVTKKTDAGIYTAQFQPKTGYRWAADLSSKKVSVPWEILRAEIITLPVQTDIPEYDKNLHEPSWENRQEDKISISITKQKYPGTYKVTATPKKNYQWASTITDDSTAGYPLFWRINKRVLDEPTLSQNSFPYTGQQYDISSMIVGQNSYMTRTGSLKQKNKGKYWITFKINTDYCQWKNTDGDTVKLLWSIGYTIVQIPRAAVTSFSYNKKEHTLTITGETEYCTRHGVISRTNAGKYDVWYTLINKDSTVWEDDTVEDKYIHWEITPQALIKPYLRSTINPNFVWDGKEKEIKLSDIIGYDPVTMILVSDTFKATAKGNYLISFVLRDSINYRWATSPYYEEVRIPWSIGSVILKNPTILPQNREIPFTGGQISPVIQDKPSEELVDQIGTISSKDLGDYEVIYTLLYPDRHSWETETEDGDVHLPWKITERTLQVPVISGASKFSYQQGKKQGPTILHYDDQKSFLKRTGHWLEEDAGDYTVTFSLAYEEGIKFSGTTDTSVSLSWSVSGKVAPSIFSQDGVLYYSAKMLQPAISGYDSRYHYKEGEVEASEVGVHRLFILPKDNYVWSDSTRTAIPIDWRIEGRSVPLPKANPSIYDYTGSDITLILTADKSPGGEYLWITVTRDREAVPGSYTAKIVLRYPESTYFVDDKGNKLDIRETEIPWQIKIHELDKPRLKQTVFEYDQNSSIYITGKDNDGRYLYIENYNPEYMKASGDIVQFNKGSYETRIDLDPDQDLVWRDQSTNTVVLAWSIAGELLTLAQSVWQPDEEIPYDGYEHRAPFSVYNAVYHKYDVEKSVWFGTEAKTYHIYVRPAKNYSWSTGTDEERDMTWEIAAIKIPVPKISGPDSFSYSKEGSKVRIIDDQSPYIRITGDDEFQTKPKTYSRTFTLMDDNVSFSGTTARAVTLSWTILADQKIDKPEAAITSYEYNEGADIRLILKEILNTDFVTQTGIDHSSAVGDYTAIYVVDTTTSLWSDGTTAPVRISWHITRKKIPAANSSFSLTEKIIANGTTHYVIDYLEGYNSKYHTLSGVTYRKDPSQNLVLKIDVKPNYAWSDGSVAQKSLVWSVDPPDVGIEIYADSAHTQRIYSITLDDQSDTLISTIYIKTSEAVQTISVKSDDENIVTVSNNKGSGKAHVFELTGIKTGSTVLRISVPATNNYNAVSATLTVHVSVTKISFGVMEWADIKAAVNDGTIADIVAVGETKILHLDGSLGSTNITGNYLAVVIGINHNPAIEGSSNIVFSIKDLSGKDIAFAPETDDECFYYSLNSTTQITQIGEPYVPVIIPPEEDTNSTLTKVEIPNLTALDPIMSDKGTEISWSFRVENFDSDIMTYTITNQTSNAQTSSSFTVKDSSLEDRISSYYFDSEGNARLVGVVVSLKDTSTYCWSDNSTTPKSVFTTLIPYKLPFNEIVQDIPQTYTGRPISLIKFSSTLQDYSSSLFRVAFKGFSGNSASPTSYTEEGTYTIPLTPKRARQWADSGIDTRDFVITISPDTSTIGGGDSDTTIGGGDDTVTIIGGDDTDTTIGGSDTTTGGSDTDTTIGGGGEPVTIIGGDDTDTTVTVPVLTALSPVLSESNEYISWNFRVENFDSDVMTYKISKQSNKVYTTNSFSLIDSGISDQISNYCFDTAGNPVPVEIVVSLKDTSKYHWSDNSTSTKTVTADLIPYQIPFNGLTQDISQTYTGNSISLLQFSSVLQNFKSTLIFRTFFRENFQTSYKEEGSYTISMTPKRGRQWQDNGTDTRTFSITISPDTRIKLDIPTLTALDPVMIEGKEISWGFQINNFSPELMKYDITNQRVRQTNASFTLKDDGISNDRISTYQYDKEGNLLPVEIVVSLNDPVTYCWSDHSTETKSATADLIPYKLPFNELVQDITQEYTGKRISILQFNSSLQDFQYMRVLGMMFQDFYDRSGNDGPIAKYYTEAGTYTIPLTPKRSRQWADGGTDTRNFVISIIEPRIYLNSYSWQDIAEFNRLGTLPSLTFVGDYKTVTLTGNIGTTDISGEYAAVVTDFNNGADSTTTRSVHFSFMKMMDGTLQDIAFAGTDDYFKYSTVETDYIIQKGDDATTSYRPSLEDYSWDEIKSFVEQGLAANIFSIGDKKSIILEGTVGDTDITGDYLAVILDIDHNMSGTLQHSLYFGILNNEGEDIAFVGNTPEFVFSSPSDTNFSYRKYHSRYLTDKDSKKVQIQADYTLEDYGWDEIKEIVNMDLSANVFSVGDKKTIKISGELGQQDISGTYQAMIIGINHDDGFEASNKSLHFSIVNSSGEDIAFVGNTSDNDTNFSYRKYTAFADQS